MRNLDEAKKEIDKIMDINDPSINHCKLLSNIICEFTVEDTYKLFDYIANVYSKGFANMCVDEYNWHMKNVYGKLAFLRLVAKVY